VAKLTEKQKRFVDEYLIDLNATQATIRVFGNLRGFKNTHLVDDPVGMVADVLMVLRSPEAPNYRKHAAMLLLKILTNKDLRDELLADGQILIFDRNDPRVTRWKKSVLSRGCCKICGATDNLCAHHVLHWSDYIAGRADEKNGECLCATCHAKQHVGERAHSMMISALKEGCV